MAKRLAAINQLRANIVGQGMVDLEKMAGRVAKNTTFNPEEIYSILRLYVREANAALQAGETVKMDDLLSLSATMKVGGSVGMAVRPDRGAAAGLNNPRLWTAAKVENHENMTRTADELVAQWNAAHPDDPVED